MKSCETYRKAVIFWACIAAMTAFSGVNAEPVGKSPEQLLAAIKNGGYVIYMRHGPTNHQQEDSDTEPFNHCQLQRNLSNKGRAITAMIGKKVNEHAIPVATVLSSPYCRCKETAKLVFGDFIINNDLQYSIKKNAEESESLGKALLEIMLSANTENGNVFIVGHSANLNDGLGVWPKPEGAWVIFQRKNEQMIVQGLIEPNDWQNIKVMDGKL